MKVIETVAQRIIKNLRADSKFIFALCGAADLGKSYFSEQLAHHLCKRKVATSLLPLDSYLIDRTLRSQKQLSGYQAEAYDLASATKAIESYLEGKEINYFPYCHKTGKKQTVEKKILPAKVLLVEGLHSMHPILRVWLDYSIFISTEDEYLRKIRRHADREKRGQTADFSAKSEPIEFRKYKDFVEPYKELCHLHIFLEKKWHYTIMDSATHETEKLIT